MVGPLFLLDNFYFCRCDVAAVVFNSFSSTHTSLPSFLILRKSHPTVRHSSSVPLTPVKKTKETVHFCHDQAVGNQPNALEAGQLLLGLAVGNTAQVRLPSGSSRGAFLFLRVWLLWACPLFSLPLDLGSDGTSSVCAPALPSTSTPSTQAWLSGSLPRVWTLMMFFFTLRIASAYPNRRCFHIK